MVKKYRGPLFSFLLRYIGDEEEAADILQDAFLRAWEKLQGFRSTSSFKTWLFQIAINLWKNRLRSSGRMVEKEELPDIPSSSNPLEEVMAAERRTILLRGIEQLPERQRMALTLKAFADLKYEEIAEVMGCSVGAAKAHFHHAFYKLKEIMEGIGEL